MIKLIIYGVASLEVRRLCENYLNRNKYQIMGYCDDYYNKDILSGEKFWLEEELGGLDFDYLLLCSWKLSTMHSKRERLVKYGIDESKIINSTLFNENFWAYDKFKFFSIINYIKEEYRGEEKVILGLSYSQIGLDVNKINDRYFNISWHSLDLYYLGQCLRYINDLYPNRIDRAVMVIPYYYFDYDMSRSLYPYTSGDIIAVRDFGFHNHNMCEGANDYIVNFDMFCDELSEVYKVRPVFRKIWDEQCNDKGTAIAKGMIVKEYDDVCEENIRIFNELLAWSKKKRIKMDVVIPPILFSAFDELSHEVIQTKKDRFYSMIKRLDYEVKIFDCSRIYEGDNEMFFDPWHLNRNGRDAFSEYYNDNIK